jgi:hypothetical protein
MTRVRILSSREYAKGFRRFNLFSSVGCLGWSVMAYKPPGRTTSLRPAENLSRAGAIHVREFFPPSGS